MRASFAALAFAFVSLVSAQAAITDSPDVACTVTYTTAVTSTCTTSTSSYCPVCDADHYTTTYDYVFTTFCPTGLTLITHPVTETLTSGAPTSTGCPQGYTTTVETCTTCGSAPVTATLVVPKVTQPGVASATGTGAVATFTGAAVRENVGKVAAAVAVMGAMLL